jgi:hypothetical protein
MMNEKAPVVKRFEIEVATPESGADNSYFALFGTLELFRQASMDREETVRVVRSIAEFLGVTTNS